MEALTAGGPLRTIMELIVKSIEAEDSDALCTILLLDEERQHLWLGAAPSLPDSFNQAIQGAKIGGGEGTCGTAASTGKRVITEDVLMDPKWDKYRELAVKANLRACWSEPIISSAG